VSDVGLEIGYRAEISWAVEAEGARCVIRVRISVCCERSLEDGARRVVWNSSVFIPATVLGGSRGARCAWWIGWACRT